MNKLNVLNISNHLSSDIQKTNDFAIDIRKDLLLGEATLPEYCTYVRFCLKRIDVIIKVIETSSYKDDLVMVNLLEKANELKNSLLIMKGHAGTKTDTNTLITCNSLLKSFKNSYNKYLSNTEIDEIYSSYNI